MKYARWPRSARQAHHERLLSGVWIADDEIDDDLDDDEDDSFDTDEDNDDDEDDDEEDDDVETWQVGGPSRDFR